MADNAVVLQDYQPNFSCFRAKREQLEKLLGLLPESQSLDCLVCATFTRHKKGHTEP